MADIQPVHCPIHKCLADSMGELAGDAEAGNMAPDGRKAVPGGTTECGGLPQLPLEVRPHGCLRRNRLDSGMTCLDCGRPVWIGHDGSGFCVRCRIAYSPEALVIRRWGPWPQVIDEANRQADVLTNTKTGERTYLTDSSEISGG